MLKTLTDKFEEYVGTKEYEGIVTTIQRWFYGELVRDSWCATSVSYFADQLGILSQIGGKNENVYLMMEACRKAAAGTGIGTFFYRDQIPQGAVLKRGAIVFQLNEGTKMTTGSRKHVTTSQASLPYTGRGSFMALGGNQSDGILPKSYQQRTIYAVFYPIYGKDPRDFVRALYKGALGRDGETAGVKWWTDGLACEAQTGATAAQGFFLGEEYLNRQRNDRQYLEDLYQGLLGREPDEKGFNYWIGQLETARLQRRDILKGFVISAEFLNRCNAHGIFRGSWA
ncbi:MAG: DUF4214 domain-containing protein [Oscillospiraceae bacterium]|nr:DUF4214 domain-containing protein [Oscillospiraceae bacterium]